MMRGIPIIEAAIVQRRTSTPIAEFEHEIDKKIYERFGLVLFTRAPKRDVAKIGEPQRLRLKKLNILDNQKRIEEDAKCRELFNWINILWAKSGLSLKDFAVRLGRNERTIKRYKYRSGHFPSRPVFEKLFALEEELNNGK